jgi:hypothetical protein
MLGRPTGSLAITVAVAIVGTAAAFSLATLVVTPGNPIRLVAEAMLAAPDPVRPDMQMASEHDGEPETTGSVALPLRRDE